MNLAIQEELGLKEIPEHVEMQDLKGNLDAKVM